MLSAKSTSAQLTKRDRPSVDKAGKTFDVSQSPKAGLISYVYESATAICVRRVS